MAIFDFSTSNKSWEHMHYLLEGLGVSNNMFFLILEDEGLRGIDPYGPLAMSNPEIQRRIHREVVVNPFYYFREVWRMKDESGEWIKFRLDIATLAALWLQLQNFNTYLEKPRQTGKTVYNISHLGYNYAFRSRNSDYGLYNYDDLNVRKELQRVLEYLDNLPIYLQIHNLEVKTDKRTGEEVIANAAETGKTVKVIHNTISSNKIVANTCGQTPDSADKTGKGGTFPIQVWDELGFVRHIEIALGSGLPAQTTAGENAAKAGLPNYVACMTTPPDATKPQGAFLYEFFKVKSLKFQHHMFDMSTEDLTITLKKNAAKDFFFISYQYYEIGMSEEWAEKQMRKLGVYTYRRDILLQWIKDYSASPFSPGDLDNLEKMTRVVKSVCVKIMEYYEIKVFEYNGLSPEETLELFHDRPIVFGIDVSAGGGRESDKSTIVGSCPITGETIVTLRTNEADTYTFSKIIHEVVVNYFTKALIVVERNSYGQSIVDNLSVNPDLNDIEDQLYYMTMTEKERYEINNTSRRNSKGRYGIFNQKSIRPVLFNVILMDLVQNKKRLIKSDDIYEEISTLITKGDRIDHKEGCHDDLVVGKLFSLYPLLYDEDLETNFGIPNIILLDDDDAVNSHQYIDINLSNIRPDIPDELLSVNGVTDLDSLIRMSHIDIVGKHAGEESNLLGKLIDKVDGEHEDYFNDTSSSNVVKEQKATVVDVSKFIGGGVGSGGWGSGDDYDPYK